MTIDEADRESECGTCAHSPAYHDGACGRPCRAWNPDEDDNKCACKGWAPPKPKYVPPPEAASW